MTSRITFLTLAAYLTATLFLSHVSVGAELCCDDVDEICELKAGTSSPQKVAKVAEPQLREIPDVLRVRCQVALNPYDRPVASSLCVSQMEVMLTVLKRRFPSLVAEPSDIEVLAERTCRDLGLPNEIVDECHALQLYGYVPIRFK